MNKFFCSLICGILATLAPPSGFAQSTIELIEQLPSGSVNWTRGIVCATGIVPAPPSELPNHSAQAAHEALDLARIHVYETINLLRVSNCHSLYSLIATKKREYQQVKEMAMAAEVVRITELPDGSVEVGVQLALFGGFAQLILPQTIRQVEPIKPLSPLNIDHGLPEKSTAHASLKSTELAPYTGLIVDARGIGLEPSMVPVIVDESGQEVYGPAFVSREFAVQNGVCQYVKWDDDFAKSSRVAPNPLIIKGVRMTPGSCSKIVVSNADASRLKGSSAHLGFLKQCRVVIALDSDPE